MTCLELRPCPLCSRTHVVARDGTIKTWIVLWHGNETRPRRYLSRERTERLALLRARYGKHPPEERQEEHLTHRQTEFIHYEDALAEYAWIKHLLLERGDWLQQSEYLVLLDGGRASWYDLFESPDTIWWA